MKEKFLKLREQFLQAIADFIYNRLKEAKTNQEFEFWMWYGLNLDYWCVEHNIWLN